MMKQVALSILLLSGIVRLGEGYASPPESTVEEEVFGNQAVMSYFFSACSQKAQLALRPCNSFLNDLFKTYGEVEVQKNLTWGTPTCETLLNGHGIIDPFRIENNVKTKYFLSLPVNTLKPFLTTMQEDQHRSFRSLIQSLTIEWNYPSLPDNIRTLFPHLEVVEVVAQKFDQDFRHFDFLRSVDHQQSQINILKNTGLKIAYNIRGTLSSPLRDDINNKVAYTSHMKSLTLRVEASFLSEIKPFLSQLTACPTLEEVIVILTSDNLDYFRQHHESLNQQIDNKLFYELNLAGLFAFPLHSTPLHSRLVAIRMYSSCILQSDEREFAQLFRLAMQSDGGELAQLWPVCDRLKQLKPLIPSVKEYSWQFLNLRPPLEELLQRLESYSLIYEQTISEQQGGGAGHYLVKLK